MEPSKQLKQTFQIEHNICKDPNLPETNQLAIYKRGQGFETNPGSGLGTVTNRAGLRVRHADHSATLPPPKRQIASIRAVSDRKPLKLKRYFFRG